MIDIPKLINDAWYGREKLKIVFWYYQMLIGFAFNLLGKIFDKYFFVEIFAFYIIYQVWTLKSLYSCRFNSRFQNTLPRIIVIYVLFQAFILILAVSFFVIGKINLINA